MIEAARRIPWRRRHAGNRAFGRTHANMTSASCIFVICFLGASLSVDVDAEGTPCGGCSAACWSVMMVARLDGRLDGWYWRFKASDGRTKTKKKPNKSSKYPRWIKRVGIRIESSWWLTVVGNGLRCVHLRLNNAAVQDRR